MSALGIIGKIFGGTAEGVIGGISDAIDKFVETPEEKEAAAIIRKKMEMEPMKLQAEINKISAAHRSVWVSGWRPAVGWVLAISLGLYYIPQFLVISIVWTKMCYVAMAILPYPVSAISGLLELLTAMLGLAVIRTVEKVKGLTR